MVKYFLSAFLLFAISISALGQKPIKIGVCSSIKNVKDVEVCDYFEINVTADLVPDKPDSVFQQTLQIVKAAKRPVYSANCLFYGNTKLIGDKADPEFLYPYLDTVFKRAQIAGVKVVVFGSGNSRRIPDNMDFTQARNDFIVFCTEMAKIARKYKIVVVLEPLNPKETNLVNTTLEGAEIVRKVKSRNFRLLADYYHMVRSGEDVYDNILKVKDVLYHCHIAEKESRTAPGVKRDDFSQFFKALHDISYKGKLSIEASMDDYHQSLNNSVNYLKKYNHAN